jgi:kinesin family protein 2/24
MNDSPNNDIFNKNLFHNINNNPNHPHQKISKIKVVVRKRPANQREQIQNDIDIIEKKGKDTIIVKELKNKVDLTKYIEEHHFTFDAAYDEKSTNQQIYNEIVKPMIKAAFEKTKITCFAYGQTGSGKTYTMMGNNHIENDKGPTVPGLYLLSAVDMFNYLSMEKYSNLTFFVSFYEIYCNKLFDLLNNKNLLQAREDGKGNICIAGLIEKEINNLNELMNIIDFGLNGRTTGITGANLDSSRSHAILQIAIRTKDNNSNYGKISFIDLAGSERAVDTIDTNKQTKIDGAEINKSLLALKECIRALDQEKRHKPFRGSKLTLVLRDSFIGNCLTLMIANISPCLSCSEHTLNTLRYADRVKELRKPKHERDLTPNKKDPNDVLADLLMMPRQHNKALKYTVEIKKNGNVSASNFTNHNYNYNHLKNNQKDYYNEGNINIQKPANDIMKIDDLIKNENIPLKKDLKNSNNGNSGNNSSSRKNNLKNRPFTSNQNNRNNYISNNNYQNKYCNYQRKPINKDNSFEEKQNKELNADEYVSIYKDVKITSDEEYQQLSNLHEDLINNILTEEESFISKHKSHIDDMVDSLKKVKIKFFYI